ncbi:MAG TPA: M1 family aminopeptidase, partial [Candidatus Omnitrophota bacterium]|nr:M1 family aminopeptidase [Candidatus Omnitrophota bacterium]
MRCKIIFIFSAVSLILVRAVFAYEVPSYDINCSLNTVDNTLEAQEKVIFTNNSDKNVGEVFFHIYPNRKYSREEKRFVQRYAGYFKVNPYPEGFQDSQFKINSVESKQAALSFNIEGDDLTILKVKLAKELLPKQKIELTIKFNFVIPHAYGRFGWHSLSGKQKIISLGRWYPILSVLDKEGWHNYPFYPYHQPFFSDAANYKVKISLPKNQVIVHSGSVVGETENSDAIKTVVIASDKPIRDFSMAISDSFKVYALEYNGIKINSYYLSGDDFCGQKAAEFASGLIKFYSEQFTNYPYKEFSIVPVYLGYGGNQSSNIILMDTRIYKLPKFLIRYFDFLVSHETGHQWFYNLVGSDEYKEMWIDEGINSYFLLEYLESKYGKDASVLVLPKRFEKVIPNFSFREAASSRYIFLAKNGMDRPVLGKLSSFKEPSSIFSLTYGKGSMVLSMLRYIVGESAFKRIFNRYFKEYSFRNISVNDFIRVAEEESKQKLNGFFDSWLNSSKFCDYAVKEVAKDKIILENRGSIQMPVKTVMEFEDGKFLIDTWFDDKKTRELMIQPGRKLKSVKIDPGNNILDIDRINNFWPKSLYKRPVGLYYFVYEIPIFLNRDFYNLVYGPELASSGLGGRLTLQRPYDNILSLSTIYDFSEKVVKSVVGFEQRHILNKQLSLGFEIFNNQDTDGREDDLDGGKVYLRRELWPASYGLAEVNDHVSIYLIRNRDFEKSLISSNREDIDQFSYKRRQEAIAGADLTINRAGPYPDPEAGFKSSFSLENAGHFMGGRESFTRLMLDLSKYQLLFPRQKIALRLKYGLGYPDDKNLYYLGGYDALRGYD